MKQIPTLLVDNIRHLAKTDAAVAGRDLFGDLHSPLDERAAHDEVVRSFLNHLTRWYENDTLSKEPKTRGHPMKVTLTKVLLAISMALFFSTEANAWLIYGKHGLIKPKGDAEKVHWEMSKRSPVRSKEPKIVLAETFNAAVEIMAGSSSISEHASEGNTDASLEESKPNIDNSNAKIEEEEDADTTAAPPPPPKNPETATKKVAKKAATQVARIGAGAYIGGKVGKVVAGGPVGAFVGVTLSSESIACDPGEVRPSCGNMPEEKKKP